MLQGLIWMTRTLLEPVKQETIRRNQIEILVEILAASVGGLSKTSLARRSGLSFRRFEKYLALLEGNGLLECFKIDGMVTPIYRITGKGLVVEKMLVEVQKLVTNVFARSDQDTNMKIRISD